MKRVRIFLFKIKNILYEKNILLLYIFTLFSFSINGQNIDYYDNIIPPSPNVLALTKFGNIPVNYATGIPSVSVPVYSYKDNASGLELDISLDYHAGGIRVDEIASNVGSGWTLNAGGAVSRTLCGIADESDMGYWNIGMPRIENGNSPLEVQDRPFVKMYHGKMDSQIDQFSYAINRRFGQFMWGKNNDLLILKQEKIDIQKNISTIDYRKMITQITITDEKGFKYIFDQYEITTAQSDAYNSKHTSAWYIGKIFSPSGKDSICFRYEDTHYEYTVGANFQKKITNTLIYASNHDMEAISYSLNIIKGKRLSEIIFPNSVNISFIYNADIRKDLLDYALLSIVINDNNTKKTYKLEQDYSINRLALKEVDILDINGQSEGKYRFKYNGILPDRLVFQQDHWGFYNSNTGDMTHKEYHKEVGKSIGLGDRKTDHYRVLCGSLSEIYYPTGGYTKFEMEANQAVDPRLSRKWVEIISSRTKTATLYLDGKNSTVPTECNFEFDGDNESQTKYKFKIPISSSPAGGTAIFDIYNSDNIHMQRHICDLTYRGNYYKTFEFSTSTFSKGKYKIKAYLNGCQNCTVYGSFEWEEDISKNPIENIKTERELYVGGLRIKKKSDYDGINNSPIQIREYDYTHNSESSGSLGIYPKYSYRIYYDFAKHNVPNEHNYIDNQHSYPLYLITSSSTIYTLAQLGGSPVIYKKVTEYVTNNKDVEGYTERYFQGFEMPTIDGQFPFTPVSFKSWIYGLPDSTKVYNKDKKLVWAERNEYKFYLNQYVNRINNFENFSLSPVIYSFSGDDLMIKINWGDPLYFKARHFYPEEGRAELISKTTENYENGQKIKTKEEYTYSPYNRQVESEKIIGSKNETVIKKYLYPQDIINNKQDVNKIYEGMMKRGMNGVLVEQKEIVNNNQVNHFRTNYYYDTRLLAYLPKSYEQFFDGKSPASTLTCTSYTNNVRIQSYLKDDKLQKIILWSYNGQYPVAEIINATYQEAEAAVKAVFGVKSIDELSALKTPDTAKLRKLFADKNLAKAHVTVYTYQPLVGITSKTDSQGITTTYHYDPFGRLKYIADMDGKKIEEYDYHYKNQ